MKGNQFVTIASVVVAAASAAYAAGRSAQTPATSSSPVLVTNSTSQCVPVSLYHTISVPTTPKNAPASPLFTKDVDETVRNAFRYSIGIILFMNSSSGNASFTVPAGHTLLIRSIEGWTDSPTSGDQVIEMFVKVIGSQSTEGYWATQFVPVPGDPATSTINTTEAYLMANSGETVTLTPVRQDANSANSAIAYVTVAGELVTSS